MNTSPSANPYLTVDAYENTQVYYSPGSPIITSNGTSNFVAWNLDTGVGVYRGNSLVNTKPYLVAVNATSTPVTTLFRSAAGTLHAGGKYNEPSTARGKIFVGTDRIQVLGVTSNVLGVSAGGTASGKYLADVYFGGGSAGSTGNSITLSQVTNPAPASVYQHSRNGTSTVGFQYVFPGLVPQSSYSVRLHFCDPSSTATGQRVFTVTINGATVLSSYDIFAQAGAANTARAEPFNAVADSNGRISVVFLPVSGPGPMVSAIEINALPTNVGEEAWYDWLWQNGLYSAQAAIAGPIGVLAKPDASPANDGIANLWKYTAGLNPNLVDSSRVSVPQMSLFDAGGGVKFVQFSFRELIATPAGLSFVIETTPTLTPSNWTAQPATQVSAVATGDGVTQTVTLRLNAPVSTSQLFARMRSTLAH